jgi:hypothetical protein
MTSWSALLRPQAVHCPLRPRSWLVKASSLSQRRLVTLRALRAGQHEGWLLQSPVGFSRQTMSVAARDGPRLISTGEFVRVRTRVRVWRAPLASPSRPKSRMDSWTARKIYTCAYNMHAYDIRDKIQTGNGNPVLHGGCRDEEVLHQ